MRYAFIDAEKAFPVTMLCRMLQVSRSGFYDWRSRSTSRRAIDDQRLLAEIRAVFNESRGNYGSPRVHAELRARGWRVSRKRVERLMRDNGIQARRKRRFRRTTNSKHNRPVAPNVLDRRFDVETPNSVWAGDVTYIWTLQGWMYLAVIIDLFSRRVVGWAMSNRNDTKLALEVRHRPEHEPQLTLAANRVERHQHHRFEQALGFLFPRFSGHVRYAAWGSTRTHGPGACWLGEAL